MEQTPIAIPAALQEFVASVMARPIVPTHSD
jgi:hypothetical protein